MAWQHGGPFSGGGPPWGTGSPPWGSGGPGWWSNSGGQTSIETHTVVATQTVTDGQATIETTQTQIITQTPTVSPSLSSPKSSSTSLSASSTSTLATISGSNPNPSIPSHSTNTPSTSTASQHQYTPPVSSASDHNLSNSATATITSGSIVAVAASAYDAPLSGTDAQFTSNPHSSHGALIGGVIGGILIFMLLGVLAVFALRRRRRLASVHFRDMEQVQSNQTRHVSGLGATMDISTANNSHLPNAILVEPSMSPTSTRPMTETLSFPLANNSASQGGYGYLDRRTTKLMREKERYRTSENPLLRSDSINTSGHGHSVESSTNLLANSAPPESETALNTEEELQQLRVEVGLLRAREAERSWERREGDEEVLPAYESGPPRARQPRH